MSRDDSPLNNSRIWYYSHSHQLLAGLTYSRARLQLRFFLNLFNCLLTTDLSWRNNRSRTGPQTLFNFRRNGNRQWIPFTFHVYSRNLAATKDVHSTATECKWLTFRFTTMIQCNPSAHTAWLINVNMLRYSCIPMIYAGQRNWNRASSWPEIILVLTVRQFFYILTICDPLLAL